MGRISEQNPWEVSDEVALSAVPSDGFIAEYVSYARDCSDTPAWFHLGSILTCMSTLAAGREIRVLRSDGKIKYIPTHLWSALVGVSGSRKSGAMHLARNLVRRVSPGLVLANDASVEAWHDTLHDETGGIGLIAQDELAWLFDQAKRSYSSTLIGWLLSSYEGFLDRSTKGGGRKIIPRVRLSILGCIPPDTLARKTTREDWRSGFLTRFLYWGADRERWKRMDATDDALEARFAAYLGRTVVGDGSPLIVPSQVVEELLDWVEDEVERRRAVIPEDLFSCMTRLQGKGIRIACFLALADYRTHVKRRNNSGGIIVESEHIQGAIRILHIHRDSLSGLFSLVSASAEVSEETSVLQQLMRRPGSTMEDLVSALGQSRWRLAKTLKTLVEECSVEVRADLTDGVGAPKKRYFLR